MSSLSSNPQHGFTSVDQQDDPIAWVRVLDRLCAEPFYAAYKRRVLELLRPEDGGWYLDVGAGTGDDAKVIASKANCTPIALDRSLTMAATCYVRARIPAVLGDVHHLPFHDQTFDGIRADRTFQHLNDPAQALAEIVRVSKAGARVVTVDPDYDTQVMELPDQALALRVLRYRADYMLRNGTLAHQMAGMFRDIGLRSIEIEPLTLTVRDPTAVDNVMGLRTWAHTAASNGCIAKEDAERWERLFDQAVESGRFLYALTFFITVGTKP